PSAPEAPSASRTEIGFADLDPRLCLRAMITSMKGVDARNKCEHDALKLALVASRLLLQLGARLGAALVEAVDEFAAGAFGVARLAGIALGAAPAIMREVEDDAVGVGELDLVEAAMRRVGVAHQPFAAG